MENIKIDTSEDSINKFFDRKIDKIYPSIEEFKHLLKSGKRLRFYMGVDVTAPKLHIGHIIPFLKMAQLQKMGHEIIFLIGDFTGKIGDPSDKSAARKKLTEEEVENNSKAFQEQLKAQFNFEDPINPPILKFNSTWNSKLTLNEVIELSSNFTVQQMLERDMFQKRITENKPIYLHEFLYPLIQGYDSVAMEVDGEFGGSDQTFNMLAGRTLSKILLKKEKYVLTMKLLLSSDGVNKMSKSIGNCIFILDSPTEKYGKIMSLPDTLIFHYYELLSNLGDRELEVIQQRVKDNPMQIKKELAFYITEMFNGEEEAKKAQLGFENTFQKKELPTEMVEFNKSELAKFNNNILLKDLLTYLKLTQSNSESKRLILEGAVEVDKIKINDVNYKVDIDNTTYIKVGKRNWIKLI